MRLCHSRMPFVPIGKADWRICCAAPLRYSLAVERSTPWLAPFSRIDILSARNRNNGYKPGGLQVGNFNANGCDDLVLVNSANNAVPAIALMYRPVPERTHLAQIETLHRAAAHRCVFKPSARNFDQTQIQQLCGVMTRHAASDGPTTDILK